jgi:hypothetical protein
LYTTGPLWKLAVSPSLSVHLARKRETLLVSIWVRPE